MEAMATLGAYTYVGVYVYMYASTYASCMCVGVTSAALMEGPTSDGVCMHACAYASTCMHVRRCDLGRSHGGSHFGWRMHACMCICIHMHACA